MKITPSNYLSMMDKIGVKNLTPELKEFHLIITEAFPSIEQFQQDFKTESDIKADFQVYFDQLEKRFPDVLNAKSRSGKVVRPPKTITAKTGKKIRAGMKAKASERIKMSSRLLKFMPNSQQKALRSFETDSYNQIVKDLNQKVAAVPRLYTYDEELIKARKVKKALKFDNIYQANLHYFNSRRRQEGILKKSLLK